MVIDGAIKDKHGYPRPMLERPEWINLNGWWEFTIDADGRFELQGLVPGATYQLSWVESRLRTVDEPDPLRGRVTGNLVLKPGEVRDLGEVKVMGSF